MGAAGAAVLVAALLVLPVAASSTCLSFVKVGQEKHFACLPELHLSDVCLWITELGLTHVASSE